jgi:hypothetical protein
MSSAVSLQCLGWSISVLGQGGLQKPRKLLSSADLQNEFPGFSS